MNVLVCMFFFFYVFQKYTQPLNYLLVHALPPSHSSSFYALTCSRHVSLLIFYSCTNCKRSHFVLKTPQLHLGSDSCHSLPYHFVLPSSSLIHNQLKKNPSVISITLYSFFVYHLLCCFFTLADYPSVLSLIKISYISS